MKYANERSLFFGAGKSLSLHLVKVVHAPAHKTYFLKMMERRILDSESWPEKTTRTQFLTRRVFFKKRERTVLFFRSRTTVFDAREELYMANQAKLKGTPLCAILAWNLGDSGIPSYHYSHKQNFFFCHGFLRLEVKNLCLGSIRARMVFTFFGPPGPIWLDQRFFDHGIIRIQSLKRVGNTKLDWETTSAE